MRTDPLAGTQSPRRTRMLRAIPMALPVFLLVALLNLIGFLEGPGFKLNDFYNRSSTQAGVSERVVVVGFSESDFKFARQFPISDDLLAQVLERITAAKPAAIFLNVLRDIPNEPGHARLLAAYRDAPMLYAFDSAGPGAPAEAPAPPGLREAGRFGFLKSVTDSDGVTRTQLLGYFEEGRLHESGLLMAIRAYLRAQPGQPEISIDHEGTLHAASRNLPRWRSRDDDPALSLANYRLPFRFAEGVQMVSFEQLLTGAVSEQDLRGKLVLIGASALTVQRAQNTPLRGMADRGLPAVAVNAQNAANLLAFALDGAPGMRALPSFANALLVLAVAWFACWRLLSYRSVWGGLLRGAIVLCATALIGWLAFRLGLALPVVPALAALLGAVLVVFQNLVVADGNQRRFIHFMNEVFDRLPDPIYAIDGEGRFKLVNQAFSRLAVAQPAQLIGAPASQVFQTAAAGGERVLIDSSGDRYGLKVQESTLADERGRPLKLCMVQALTPLPGSVEVLPAARFLQHFAVSAFWVERGSGELAVLALKLSHPDLIEAAYGTARLPGVFNATHERLTKAFPDAIWLVEPEQLRIFALLGRSERPFEAQVLRAQVAQAFSWPLELDGASLEVDLSLGVACYGADGTQADVLKALAAERATALE